MGKLSDITRRENCFITVDGHILKNIKDLLDYMLECSEDNYNYHATAQKNDFANWATDVLLCPRLGKVLSGCKNLYEARDSLMEYMKVFDYRGKNIADEKAFHTVDGYILKNLHELYYYIHNCNDGSFNYHLNSQKNDFANWVSDVLTFPMLSAKMRAANSRIEMADVLKEFLSVSETGINPENDRYISGRKIKDDDKSSEDTNVQPVSSVSYASSHAADAALDSKVEESNVMEGNDSKGEEIISLKPLNLEHEEEDEEKNDVSPLDKNAFRQFTDEELEKFTSFVKWEKNEDMDPKTEYLKAVLLELKNMIKELRRVEKDPFIADLMLRTVNAKIDYYALSKNPEDYNHIIRLMRDVQQEIEECSTQNTYNFAEEIMKDLKLQGIALKKA